MATTTPLLAPNRWERCCTAVCGTLHTGAGCGHACSIVSAVAAVIFLGFLLFWALPHGNTVAATICMIGLVVSIISFCVGRVQVIRHTPVTTVSSPYTGQTLIALVDPRVGLSELLSREQGESVGQNLSQNFFRQV
jgi:hypothetical protein